MVFTKKDWDFPGSYVCLQEDQLILLTFLNMVSQEFFLKTYQAFKT